MMTACCLACGIMLEMKPSDADGRLAATRSGVFGRLGGQIRARGPRDRLGRFV